MKTISFCNRLIITILSLALAATALAAPTTDEILQRASDCTVKLVSNTPGKADSPTLRLIWVNDNGTDLPFAVELARYRLKGDITQFQENSTSGKSKISLVGTAERKGPKILVFSGRFSVALDFIGARKPVETDSGATTGASSGSEFRNLILKQGVPVVEGISGIEITKGPDGSRFSVG